MKRVRRNFAREIDEIRAVLVDRDWSETKRSNELTFYRPPESLGIKGNFSIALPVDPGRPGSDRFLNEAIGVLQDVYGFRFNSLFERVANKPEVDTSAIFNFRFVDSSTSSGSLPLGSLRSFVDQMVRSIYRGAKFRLDGSSHGPHNSAATRLAEDSRFLQTETGSFVAKVEVPFSFLSQGDLFGAEVISSHDVCAQMTSAIQFINERIIKSDIDFDSDTVLSESINLFDPELLDSYAKLLVGPAVELIDISVQIGSQIRRSSTGPLTEPKIERVNDFVRFVRDHFYAEDGIDVSGVIVELRSRDPDGNKNYVRVLADFLGDKSYFSVPLNNDLYQIALDAHGSKHKVRVRGSGTRMKTQVRMDRVDWFGPMS